MISTKVISCRTWQRCAINFQIQNYLSSSYESGYSINDRWLSGHRNKINIRGFHNSIQLLAGHSKWSNIKHTKMSNDLARSHLFSKISVLVRGAVKEGGADPNVNSKLARIIEQAKTANMPKATIDGAIKAAEKSNVNAVNEDVVLSAPGGVFVVIFITSDKIRFAKQSLQAMIKRSGLKLEKGIKLSNMFEEKGIITAAVGKIKTLLQATDDAIELGAEEVTEDNGLLIFTCAPSDFDTLKEGLENLKYRIDYASIDYIPFTSVVIDDEKADMYMNCLTRLENECDFVGKFAHNF